MTTMLKREMLPRLLLLSVVCTLALVWSAGAQPLDKRTNFTFSHPVELPGGKTLPPGEYMFQLANENTGRSVVQIQNAEGEPQAMLLTLITQVPTDIREPQAQFMEVPEGQPPALRSWWYTGGTGYDFVYPREQGERLARVTGINVPMTDSPMTTEEELRTAEVSRTELENEPAPAPAPRAEQRDAPAEPVARVDRSTDEPESTVARNEPAPRTALPQTASYLPLVGMMGLLSLLGASGLRRLW